MAEPRRERSRLATAPAPDVLIVGGGAVGACIALELSRRGVSTSLIERERELGRGCSAGNMGLICPGHSAPLATPENLVVGLRYMFRPDGPLYLRPRPAMAGWLARYLWACRPANAAAGVRVMREISELSLRLHAELASEGLNETFVRRGTLSLCETEAGLEALRAEARGHSAGGLEARLLDGGEARDLEPSLGRHVRGAVFYPNEAHCDSLSFVQAVGRAAAEAGADVRTGVEVLALRRRSGRVEGVDSTEGTVRAGTVVLAGGSWSGALASTAGAFVPVQGGKGYHVEIDTGGGDPVIPSILVESRVSATPLPGRIRLGGTLELAGLDMSVRRRRVDAIVRAAQRGYPQLAGRTIRRVWRGLRPCSPDGLPIIGSSPDVERLVIATGHTHMGLALAPITGRLVAEHAAGEPTSYDLTPFSPGRFGRRFG